jgi:hypothetical protein
MQMQRRRLNVRNVVQERTGAPRYCRPFDLDVGAKTREQRAQ